MQHYTGNIYFIHDDCLYENNTVIINYGQVNDACVIKKGICYLLLFFTTTMKAIVAPVVWIITSLPAIVETIVWSLILYFVLNCIRVIFFH